MQARAAVAKAVAKLGAAARLRVISLPVRKALGPALVAAVRAWAVLAQPVAQVRAAVRSRRASLERLAVSRLRTAS